MVRKVTGTKADARRVRDEIRRDYEQGLVVNSQNMTFSEMAELWSHSREISGSASERTIKNDNQRLSHISKYIGRIKLKDLDAQCIENYMAKLRQETTLSGTSLNSIFALVKRVLRKAVDYDLILRNPCDRLKAPKKNDPERRSLDVETAAHLLQYVGDKEEKLLSEYKSKEKRQSQRGNDKSRSFVRGIVDLSSIMAVRLGLATGMRRSEVLGLTWGNLELGEMASVTVVQSLVEGTTTKEPKSKAGYRTIYLDELTTKHLSEWKEIQKDALATLGGSHVQTENTPVCCTNLGGFYDPTNFNRWWSCFRVDAGVPTLKFHELRHTQASQLLSHGVDVKTVQARMGHSNASVTLNWYAHAVPENDKKAAKVIGNLFAQTNTLENHEHDETDDK